MKGKLTYFCDRLLSDSKYALNATASVGFRTSKAKPSGEKLPMVDPLTKNDRFGPAGFSFDSMRTPSWALCATGGAYTWPHHDAAGLATFVYCRTGAKLWGYVVPKTLPGTAQEAINSYRKISQVSLDPEELADIAVSANLLITPGTLV